MRSALAVAVATCAGALTVAWVCAVHGSQRSSRRRGPFSQTRRIRQPSRQPQTPAPPRLPARELVTTYCVSCHNEKLKTGSLVLDTADAEQVVQLGGDLGKGRREAAKPRDAAAGQPPAGQRHLRRGGRLAGDGAGSRGRGPPESRAGRRISIASIAPNMPTRCATCSASRSTARSMLPPDEQAHGFDTNADALSVEPALLDRYLTAAAKIARLAVGDPTLRPAFERYTAVKGNSNEQTWLWQTERLGEDVSAGLARRHRGAPLFPGRWRVRLQGPAATGPMRA